MASEGIFYLASGLMAIPKHRGQAEELGTEVTVNILTYTYTEIVVKGI